MKNFLIILLVIVCLVLSYKACNNGDDDKEIPANPSAYKSGENKTDTLTQEEQNILLIKAIDQLSDQIKNGKEPDTIINLK